MLLLLRQSSGYTSNPARLSAEIAAGRVVLCRDGRLACTSPPAALGPSKVLIAEIPDLGDGPPPLHVGDVWSPGALLTGVRVDVQGFRPVVVIAAVGSRPPVRRNIRSITLRVTVDEYVASERRHSGSSDREQERDECQPGKSKEVDRKSPCGCHPRLFLSRSSACRIPNGRRVV